MADSSFTWTLTAFQRQGTLWLSWSTNSPFRAQQGQIRVYNGGFPTDPTADTKVTIWDDNTSNPYNTNLTWGSDWCCAWIAERSSNGPYTYFLKLVTTGQSKPDSTKSE